MRTPKDQESDTQFYPGDFVRLCGLKTVELNNALGTVISFTPAIGRYGVSLLSGDSKAIQRQNLSGYFLDKADRCPS